MKIVDIAVVSAALDPQDSDQWISREGGIAKGQLAYHRSRTLKEKVKEKAKEKEGRKERKQFTFCDQLEAAAKKHLRMLLRRLTGGLCCATNTLS